MIWHHAQCASCADLLGHTLEPTALPPMYCSNCRPKIDNKLMAEEQVRDRYRAAIKAHSR